VLLDLQPKGNKLSVWIVDDNRSNLPRIICALAANSESVSNIDYALLPEAALPLDIKVDHTKGDSADDLMNSQCHRDLIELSIQRVMDLATSIGALGERGRVSEKHVAGLLEEGIQTGRLDRSRIRLKDSKSQTLLGERPDV
jgi:hypothetical protein